VRTLRARRSPSLVVLAVLLSGMVRPAFAQSDPTVELIVPRGRPLRVALATDSTVKRVGQTVTGTLVEPVYAYDRIVLPAGTTVEGRITRLDNPSKLNRAQTMGSGDFSPHHIVELRFDAVIRDGERVPIDTIAKNETVHPTRQVAKDAAPVDPNPGVVARAKLEVKAEAAHAIDSAKHQVIGALSAVKDPGRMHRLKEWAVSKSPYHPQVLRQGTVYDAELQAPIMFGTAPARPTAPEGTLPAPASILHAQLATALDSATTPRGTRLEAVVSEPVFAEDGRLVLPEGSRLTGEVTFAEPAKKFHRNGQLRFLFERVEVPNQESMQMLASLHAIDVSGDDHVVLDDEGGAAMQNSKTRFVEPALALLALRASMNQGEGGERFAGGESGVRATAASGGGGNYLARGVGGVIGFGLIGVGLSQVSRPLGIAFGALGAARSVYKNILGKGQELRFQADTPLQLQLAPGPQSAQ
jgi:hypothetical protein